MSEQERNKTNKETGRTFAPLPSFIPQATTRPDHRGSTGRRRATLFIHAPEQTIACLACQYLWSAVEFNRTDRSSWGTSKLPRSRTKRTSVNATERLARFAAMQHAASGPQSQHWSVPIIKSSLCMRNTFIAPRAPKENRSFKPEWLCHPGR